jgi:hypothetical protein
MSNPWTDGPRELIQHAVDHLAIGGDFDRRIAMISVDNAVETTIKTWLGLPERTRGTAGPGRRQLEEASESFPSLLDLLQKFASDRIVGLSLDDVEWYHRLRNQLYHSGNGITVEKTKVETYLELSIALFESLFGAAPSLNKTAAIRTTTGEFLEVWNRFQHLLRTKLPTKDGPAYYWKRDFMEKLNSEAAQIYDATSTFRNQLVHGLEETKPEDIQTHLELLRRLARLLKIDLGQQPPPPYGSPAAGSPSGEA